jgi:sensor histidine kinase YesM
VITGILAYFVIEVIFNVRFRYYDLFSKPANYLYSCLLSVLIFELIIVQNKILVAKYPWDRDPVRHFRLQAILNFTTGVILISGIRPLVLFLFQPDRLYILSNEIWILAIVSIFILGFNLIELIIYLTRSYRASLAESEKYKKEMAEAQFEMLRMQVNPHFLFNSLNTLLSVIQEDTPKAVDFVRKLSDVYRYTLDNRQIEVTELKEEVKFMDSYLFLLMIRFNDMMTCKVDIPERYENSRIPPLTLQMLIENAVKHNIVSKKKPLKIEIFTRDENLVVRNNLQPKDNNENGSGLGLKNIQSRFAFLTDRPVIIEKDDNYFTVIIPLIS